MTNPHISYDNGEIKCSVCGTGPELIAEGRSEHFKISAMRDIQNPGKYDERLLWHAECLVCRKRTELGSLPKLYY